MNKLLLVEWDDSTSHHDWTDASEADRETPAQCMSIGWLAFENKKYIRLVATMGFDGAYNQRMMIPKGCITKRKEIKY